MGGQSVGLQMFEKAHGFKTIIKKRKNIFFVAASHIRTLILIQWLSKLAFLFYARKWLDIRLFRTFP